MTDQTDIQRHEDSLNNIFSKINKLVPGNVFITTIVVIVGFWGSLFGLMYNDMQNHKAIANEQRIEVIKEIGEVKILIEKLSK